MSENGIQACFCGPNFSALPLEPLAAHGKGCLIWDWAVANGRVGPAERIAQLEEYAQELGLNPEELARETASMPESLWGTGESN